MALVRKHNLALDAVCHVAIHTCILQKCPVLSVQVEQAAVIAQDVSFVHESYYCNSEHVQHNATQ